MGVISCAESGAIKEKRCKKREQNRNGDIADSKKKNEIKIKQSSNQ